jgi:enterochelin esterase-like enzyme
MSRRAVISQTVSRYHCFFAASADIEQMRRMFLVGLLCCCGTVWGNSWTNPPRRAVAGLEHRTFRSASMKVDVGYNICLPPDYGATEERLPVIYYLHGYEGNESSYPEYAKYWRESLSRVGPSILVFVNGGESSFFCDTADGSVAGETVVKELIAHIDRTYRTIAERGGRALHGYSMGGFGALKLGFKHPEMFHSVVAYGATLATAEEMKKHLGKVYRRVFGGDKARFEASNPLTLLQRNASALRAGMRVCLFIGTKDEFLPANRQLHERLQALQVPASMHVISGARHKKDAIYEKVGSAGFECRMERR